MLHIKDLTLREDGTVSGVVLVENKEENNFAIIFSQDGDIISSTANKNQLYYEAHARIAFKNHFDKNNPTKDIFSMWY